MSENEKQIIRKVAEMSEKDRQKVLEYIENNIGK